MSFVWTTSRPCNISEQALLGCLDSQAAKPLHAELKQLFAISGVWVRNVGDRHDTKRQILQIIRRIVPRLKV